MAVFLVSNDNVENTFEIPYPSGGYSGGSLLVSPSEKYLVFSYFSGESKEAFSLFKIESGLLKSIYDSGYMYGADAHYSFVNDDRILVQTFCTDSWYREKKHSMNSCKIFLQLNLHKTISIHGTVAISTNHTGYCFNNH